MSDEETCLHGIAVSARAGNPRACYACYLKDKDLSIAPSATPNRHFNRDNPPPAGTRFNSYESGIAKDHRGVPILDNKNGTLTPISVKEHAEHRVKYDNRAAELRNTNVQAPAQAKD